MLGRLKLVPYALAVAAVIGGFIVALTLFFPEPSQSAQTPEVSRGSVSPRIAAWQERVAEEKLYAEKEARRLEAENEADRLARQQSRDRAMARAAPQKVTPEELRAKQIANERSREIARKQKARQIAAQRQRQRFEGRVAMGYAPEPSPAAFNNIFSAMREMRGGN